MLGSSIAILFGLIMYLLMFLFVLFVAYLIIRRAVRDGILDARAKVKELEGSTPQPPIGGPFA